VGGCFERGNCNQRALLSFSRPLSGLLVLLLLPLRYASALHTSWIVLYIPQNAVLHKALVVCTISIKQSPFQPYQPASERESHTFIE